jgi:hypothetical protein
MDIISTIDAFGMLLSLTFLPGVALLIVSTANRFGMASTRIKNYTEKDFQSRHTEIRLMLRRIRLFHYALIGLYLAVSCFSLAALSGTLLSNWNYVEYGKRVFEVLTIFGVTAVVVSAILLSLESVLSTRLLRYMVYSKGIKEK